MADKRDYYEVLGVAKGASDDEIKKGLPQGGQGLPSGSPSDDKEAEARFGRSTKPSEVLS